MKHHALCLAALALACSAPVCATAPVNPLIDYPSFEEMVRDIGPIREAHRHGWDEFRDAANSDGAILLDTRSASNFARGHIAGAVDLPFSEFTDAKLASVLGQDTSRPVYIFYIYCNNNFYDNVAPVMTKRALLALNIPTFINLHGYGYTNVWEPADVLSIEDERVGWASGA
jgi:phage shock protein E